MKQHHPSILFLPMAVVLLWATPGHAQSSPREWYLTATPQYSYVWAYDHNRHGAGLSLGSAYRLAGVWHLKANVSYAPHAPAREPYDGAFHLAVLNVSMVAQLELGRWLPTFHLGVGVAILGGVGMDTEAQADLFAGVGLDYLLDKQWSIGVEIMYHLLLPDAKDFPAAVKVGFRVTRRFP